MTARPLSLSLTLLLLLGLAAVLSLSIGPGGVPFSGELLALGRAQPDLALTILTEIRLPRVIIGILVGGTLGLSGAALQGLLRNPLVEPGLIGVSSGATLGAVIAIYFGLAAQLALLLPLGGVIGALAALLLLFAVAGRDPGSLTLILAGVAIGSFATALTSLALNLAPSPFAALEIVFWMLGSLSDRSLEHLWLVAPPILLGCALIASSGRALEALTLGEDTASSLGFDLAAVKRRVIGGAALAVGAAVAVTGIIGFVGLVVPHLLRPLVGQHPRRLLFPSALGGALLLTLADIAARLLSGDQEIKLGVLTALIGAPFFLHLMIKLRRGVEA